MSGVIEVSQNYNDNVGFWGENKASEHIKTKGDNTIELSASWHESQAMRQVDALIKLINITLGGVEPSKVEGKTNLGAGETYRSTYIKSLRHYKNHTIRIIFHSHKDTERVKAALVEQEGGD